MLKAVLSGNYVNFGVFRLYGDDALDNALQTFIKLLLSIPHRDLLVGSNSLTMLFCICRLTFLLLRLTAIVHSSLSCLTDPDWFCHGRTILSSASRSTLSWKCWHRTIWTSSPAWSLMSSCTSCRRYRRGSLHSVKQRGRLVFALTCCTLLILGLCVWTRYYGVYGLLLQSGPHSDLPVQAAVPLHEEAAHPHGHGRPLPAHHAAAPRHDPTGQTTAPSRWAADLGICSHSRGGLSLYRCCPQSWTSSSSRTVETSGQCLGLCWASSCSTRR